MTMTPSGVLATRRDDVLRRDLVPCRHLRPYLYAQFRQKVPKADQLASDEDVVVGVQTYQSVVGVGRGSRHEKILASRLRRWLR